MQINQLLPHQAVFSEQGPHLVPIRDVPALGVRSETSDILSIQQTEMPLANIDMIKVVGFVVPLKASNMSDTIL